MKLGEPQILGAVSLPKEKIESMRLIAEGAAALMTGDYDIERIEIRLKSNNCYLYVFASGHWMIICIEA